jgi:hypothetical protein
MDFYTFLAFLICIYLAYGLIRTTIKTRKIKEVQLIEETVENSVTSFLERTKLETVLSLGKMYLVDSKGRIEEVCITGFKVTGDRISFQRIYEDHHYRTHEEYLRVKENTDTRETIHTSIEGKYNYEHHRYEYLRGVISEVREWKVNWDSMLFRDKEDAKEYASRLIHEKMQEELKEYEKKLEIVQNQV